MKGSIYYERHRDAWAIGWYVPEKGRAVPIRYYNGEPLYNKKRAEKVRNIMQGEVEDGSFRLERWTGKGWTDVIQFFKDWLDTKEKKKPATIKGYRSYFKNWIKPFFEKHPVMLHDVRLDTLDKLLDSIKLTGKGKYNVMNCFHAFMDYAWRSEKIKSVPPFPKKEDYQLVEPTINWLPEDRQMAIIDAIPEDDRPIFLWLKYHLRRPSEACALMWEDYDEINNLFTVRRSVSARRLVESTKTNYEHIIPCHSLFRTIIDDIDRGDRQGFIFKNPRARKSGRYTNESLNNLWNKAKGSVGESIDLYSGLKHSSCSQFVNEKGLSISDLKEITDHKRMESVRRYAKVNVARKRELLEATQKLPKLKIVHGEKD